MDGQRLANLEIKAVSAEEVADAVEVVVATKVDAAEVGKAKGTTAELDVVAELDAVVNAEK